MKQDTGFSTDQIPLACTLTQSEQMTRNEEINELFQHVQEVNELTDGYALRFPASGTWANTLVQFVTFERECCPFFSFALVFEPQQGPIWLHLRGPVGVKAIIEQMIHLKMEAEFSSSAPQPPGKPNRP